MPTWHFHVSLARLVARAAQVSSEDMPAYLFGSIYPDMPWLEAPWSDPVTSKQWDTLHYYGNDIIPQWERFLEENPDTWSSAFKKGILTHLIADSVVNKHITADTYKLPDGRELLCIGDGYICPKANTLKQEKLRIFAQSLPYATDIMPACTAVANLSTEEVKRAVLHIDTALMTVGEGYLPWQEHEYFHSLYAVCLTLCTAVLTRYAAML